MVISPEHRILRWFGRHTKTGVLLLSLLANGYQYKRDESREIREFNFHQQVYLKEVERNEKWQKIFLVNRASGR